MFIKPINMRKSMSFYIKQMEIAKQMVIAKIQQFQLIYGSRQDALDFLNSHNQRKVEELTKLKELLNLQVAVIGTL